MIKNTVSTLQKYIWLDQQLFPDSSKYNIGGYAKINDSVNLEKFKKAFTKLVNKHSIFNFSFFEENGIPVFKNIKRTGFNLDILYFENTENDALQSIKADFLIPFKLKESKNLFKIWLIKINDNSYIWYTKLHHLIADGYSFQLLFNDLNEIYSSLNESNIYENSQTNYYHLHIEEEKKYLASERRKADINFWLNKYQETPSLIYQKKKDTFVNFDKEFKLSKLQNDTLDKIAKIEKVSVFHILLASFSLVFSKFYRKEEINIGTPILNRTNRVEKKTFGPFINLIPLKFQINKEDSFLSFVKQIKKELFGCFRHQRVQQADIIKQLSFHTNRLYDIRVSYEKFNYQNKFSNQESSIVALSNKSEDDPISVHIMDYENQELKFRFDVNESYVSKFEIVELIESLKYIFNIIESISNKKIGDISIASKKQEEGVLNISQGKKIEHPQVTFLDLWKNSVLNYKTQKAVSYKDQSFSYKEIDKLSNIIANNLINYGIKKGDKVGMMLSRSEKCITSILGILKIGAVYVPIDINYPPERINYIIDDSQLKYIIVDKNDESIPLGISIDKISKKLNPNADKFDFVKVSPNDIAYIIYTSGSTGKPKGVLISHESLHDYILTFSTYFNLDYTDCVIQQSSFSFDTSIEEIFPILNVGGSLVIANSPKDFHKLLLECQKNKVTLLSTNPYTIQYLNENIFKYNLDFKTIISGGDVLKYDYISNLITTYDVYNTYGPTESTVCATYHKINTLDMPIPIGKPIRNRNTYILDENNLLPKGAVGEICLSGKGLAKAYFNKIKLTKNAFVFIDGKRIYRTGDIGKWNEKNNLLFLGRKDNQLIYRGYRIESEEIEMVIKSFNSFVTSCFVNVKEFNKTPTLIAYIVINKDQKLVKKENLFKFMKEKMPSYMIPTHLVFLDNLPLLTNGKINQKELPLPINTIKNKNLKFPSTKEELEVSKIWIKLLNIKKIDINTSFFELGGHSLLANQYVSIIREKRKQEISLKDFYENPTVKNQAELLITGNIVSGLELEPAPIQDLYPLSFPQERLWFLNELNENNKAYYVPRAINMSGVLDIKLLEKTFTELTRRHEILRTIFPVINGEPFQKILKPYKFEIPVISYVNYKKESQEKEIENFILKEGNLLFDIENGPLLRVTILKKSSKEHVLVLCEHHLIHDGWTQGVLLREFIETFTKLSKNANYRLKDLVIQFKDFSFWQKGYFKGEVLNQQLEFWKTKLENHLQVLPLPMKGKRPKEISGKGGLIVTTFEESFAEKIRVFSLKNNVTLFITMLTAFKIVLGKFSNETDICVGTAVANRRLKALDDMLGMVINTLTLRSNFSIDDTLLDVLQKVKETCFESYAYEDTPFGKVVEKVQTSRTLGLMPIFQYMFSFMNTPSRDLSLPNLELEILESHNSSAKFDINVVVVTPSEQTKQEGGMVNLDKRIIVEWEYNSDIFSAEIMNNMLSAYKKVLISMIDNSNLPISKVDYLSKKEKQKLLYDFNDTKVDYPKDKTIVDLFEEQVKKTPNNIAIVFENKELTYSEVQKKSNELANYLLSHYKIEVEDLIAVKLDRSEYLIISLLAIMKTGAAYVPIDPNYPKQRIAYIEKDSQCKLTIDNHLLKEFKKGTSSSTLPKIKIKSNNLAYIIYTSGSTGKPKGVMIEHGSLVNFINLYNLSIHNTSLTTKSIFDVSVMEIFTSITSGSTLNLPNEELVYNPDLYAEFLYKNKISHCYIHPMHIEEIATILDCHNTVYLKEIFIGVEAIRPNSIKWYISKGIKIVNAYGPTEATICSTSFIVDSKKSINTTNIPIGKPLSNYQVYILKDNQLQPQGVIGELCISGEGLSRGYLNQPKLTAEKFIPHPFKEGELLYKTGDLARWLPDGNLEFIGRKDTQVKIRGYRIELGEIEQVISTYQDVIQVVAEVKAINGQKSLVAYLVSETELDKQKLRNYLIKELPEYMVPSHYVTIDNIPLTPNGKIDRKSLPEVDSDSVIRQEYVAPKTEIEKQLVAIWQEVLGVEEIGVTDNFFELGGHSLKITQLINRIKKQLNYDVKVKDVFIDPTIESLIKKLTSIDYIPIPKTPKRLHYPLTSSQKRLWILSQFEGGNNAYNIPGVFELKGKLDKEKLETSFKEVIKRHESLRTYFKEGEKGEVQQYILPVKELEFTLNLTKLKNKEKEEEFIKSFYEEEFDLTQAPLIKAKLLEVNPDKYLLLFAMHHIISDGWSIEIFTKELLVSYNNLIEDKDTNLSKLPIQYKDFTLWKQSPEQQTLQEKQQDYWLKQFEGEIPKLELPSFKTRSKFKTYNGSTISHNFSIDFSKKLEDFSQQEGVTLFMSLMAGINALLYRYTDNTDIVLGTPIAGREHPDLEHQIGLYLNTLAIRTQFESSTNFRELLTIQKQVLLESYSHQDYPFDQLVENLNLQRDTSRSALFDVMVVLQNQHSLSLNDQIGLKGLEITPYDKISRTVSQFDLSFSFTESTKGLNLRLEYNTDIYDQEIIKRLVIHLENFLSEVISNPTKKLNEVDYLSKEEKQKLLYDFNRTKVDYSKEKTIIDLFEEQVKKTPNNIAIVFENKELTYSEVQKKSNELANYLLSHYKIEVEDLIAVKLDRSEYLIISLLAIMKTGAAYVPIDSNYPKQRIEYLEKDSQCKLTIDENLLEKFNNQTSSSTLPKVKIKSNNLAYVIYTSGSTGKPKGVMIEHGNATSLIFWALKEFNDIDYDIAYFTTSYCFDLSIFEMFYPLSLGKTIRVLENGLSISENLKNDTKVLLNTVPSVVESLLKEKIDFSNIVGLNMAGEVIPSYFTKELPLKSIKARNLYGPSEDTTYSTTYLINSVTTNSIPIGKPIVNTQIYILSEDNELQPQGVIGELCISGEGLSRGYLNRPELTKEKFISHPFKEGERLYKTGDLARWLPDGNLEFIGRKDTQVKIRGYRIELGEIEQVISTYQDVIQVVAEIKAINGQKSLVAYLVSETEIDKQKLRNFLTKELLEYMVPSHYVTIDNIPLTPNGKIDRKSLPEVDSDSVIRQEYVAPKTKVEKQLVTIWQEVLGVEKIGVTDNYFELGGNSIQVITMINMINQKFNTELTVNSIFNTETIHDLSELIKFVLFQKTETSDTEYEETII